MVCRWIPLTGKADGEPLSWPDSEIHAIIAIPRPSGDLLVTGHEDGGLRVGILPWTPPSATSTPPAGSRVRTLVHLPSSDTVVAGHNNGHVRMWNAGTCTSIF
ncbi:hypothetical protein ACFWN2_04630 [Lentzea sp. NPDC058436]|uniref:hypothetical protein n=1 Tax=Lentzea sp. NPDC058436 TaxID=3346499 RepID=UPI003653C38E